MANSNHGLNLNVLVTEDGFNSILKDHSRVNFTVMTICSLKCIQVTEENISHLRVKFEQEYKQDVLRNAGDKSYEIENFLESCTANETSDILNLDDEENEMIDVHEEEEDDNGMTEETVSENDENSSSDDSDKYDDDNDDETSWLEFPVLCLKNNRLDLLIYAQSDQFPLTVFRDGKDTLLDIAVQKPAKCADIFEYLFEHIDPLTVDDRCISTLRVLLSTPFKEPALKLDRLRRLLKAGATVYIDPTPERDSTFLHQIHCIHSYLEHLDSTNKQNDFENWKEILHELINAGESLNEKDYLQETPLMIVIQRIHCNEDEDDMLCKSQSDENMKTSRMIMKEIIKFLLDNGADPNITNADGQTCVHISMFTENIDILAMILKYGGNPKICNCRLMSPLYQLCEETTLYENIDETIVNMFCPIANVLLNAGDSVNSVAMDESIALHSVVVRANSLQLIKTLCEMGANINKQDYLKRSPLHMSVRNKDPSIAQFLISHGADIESLDTHSNTPLHHACLWNNIDVARVLIRNKCNVNVNGDNGIQPIHLAAENGTPEFMQLLCESGADINALDNDDATPLHYAAGDGNPDTTQFLLSVGADLNMRDNADRTPLDHSLHNGHLKASSILANEPTDIRFGMLPPATFPNRPLVKITDMESYNVNRLHQLRDISVSSDAFVSSILNSQGLGKVDFENGESKQIQSTIWNFASKVIDEIGLIDPMFKAKLIPAGSTFENVKVGYPDEFDYLCVLENFNSSIADVIPNGDDVFVKVVIKDIKKPEINPYLLPGNCLNSVAILRRFNKLATQSLYKVHREFKSNLYAGCAMLTDLHPLLSDSNIPITRLHGFSSTWRGRFYKFLDISIDLNPVVFVPQWPNEASKSISFIPDIENQGIYLIPKHSSKHSYPLNMKTPAVSEYWRYSTHHVEAMCMQRVSPLAKQCYMLCKCLRLEPLMCSVGVPNDTDGDDEDIEITAESVIPSYYLKCIFLSEIENRIQCEFVTASDVLCFTKHIYTLLLETLVSSRPIVSPFFPKYNIFKPLISQDQVKERIKLRQLFCESILCLLDSIVITEEDNKTKQCDVKQLRQ